MEEITHVSGKPQQSRGKRSQPGSAVQIVRLENSTSIQVSRNLKLNTQVLRELLSKADDYQIAVIVIAGPGRKGKSFMLTYIIRYLQALERSEDGDAGDWMDKANPDVAMKDKGFTFRNGMDRTTDGIWMWSKPFIIKRSTTEPPVAVLVMDTEGCFDPYTNEQEQSSIIGLSLLLSSCFIYNDTGLINENTINTLAQFMQYGQVASQSFQGKAFQRLMFLIRDWNTSGFEHGAAGGQGFIHKCMVSNPRMSEQATQNRKLIQDNFEDYNAYLMPFPGKKVVSEEFSGSIGDMKEEFRNHVEKFAVSLVADIAPKRFGTTVACRKTFFDTFEKLVIAFNAEDMPSPASILQVTVYIALDAQIRKLGEEYELKFQKKLESKDIPFLTADALQQYHDKYKNFVNTKFTGGRQIGSSEDHETFTDKLVQLVEYRFLEICKRNTMKQQEFVDTVQKSFIQKLQNFMELNISNSSKIWSQSEYKAEMSPVVDSISEEFTKQLSGTTNAFSQQQVSIFKSKLEEIIQSSWLELEEKKGIAETKATAIVEKFLAIYTTAIQVSHEILLSESQLESLHEKFKTTNVQEVSHELSKEFSDEDFIRRFCSQLESAINAYFEPIKDNGRKRIEGILSVMDEDLREILAVFKTEVEVEIQNSLCPDNPKLEKIFFDTYKMGMNTLESRNLPDLKITANYRKQLQADMNKALKEIQDSFLQSREYKLHKCESTFEDTTKAFLKAIEKTVSCHYLFNSQEIESAIEEIIQQIRPHFEQIIREMSPEDLTDFSKRFDTIVQQKKQEMIAGNADKAEQLDKQVYNKICALTKNYNQEMKIQESRWTALDQVASSHNVIYSELSHRLQSEAPLKLQPKFIEKYQHQLKEEIQKDYDLYSSNFKTIVQRKEKMVLQMIPEWIGKFENEIQIFIRNHPFADISDLAVCMEKITTEVETSHSRFASEAGINYVIRCDTMKTLTDNISKVRMILVKDFMVGRKNTDKNVDLVIQSCLGFADNHPIFWEKSLAHFSDLDNAQEKLTEDVRGYYDSKWPFTDPSSALEKVKTWDRIQEELKFKLQVLLNKMKKIVDHQSAKEVELVNISASNFLKNLKLLELAVCTPGNAAFYIKQEREATINSCSQQLQAMQSTHIPDCIEKLTLKIDSISEDVAKGCQSRYNKALQDQIQRLLVDAIESFQGKISHLVNSPSDFTQEELETLLTTVEVSSLGNFSCHPVMENSTAIEIDKFTRQLQEKIHFFSQKQIFDWKAPVQRTAEELKIQKNKEATNLITMLMQELSKYTILNEEFFREKLGNATQAYLSTVQNELLHTKFPHSCIEEILFTVKETLTSLEHTNWSGILKKNRDNEDHLVTRISELKSQYFQEVLANKESRNQITRRLISKFVGECTCSSSKDEETWRLKLEKELLAINDQIDSDEVHVHQNVLEKHIQGNKHGLESTINTVKNASICEYKKSLVEEKKWRDFNPKAPKALDTLQYIGKSAKAAATQYFQKQCNSKMLESKIPGVTQIICDHERELEEEMSAIFALEVRDVKLNKEKQDRLLELKKQDISSTEKPFPAHRQNPRPSSETMGAKGAPVRSHCQGSPRPPRNWQLNAFRRCQLVIHFGLYRTVAGIIFPASDEALVLYNIDNCVYFDHPELLLCSEDPACRKYVPSKIPNILQTMQPVYIGKSEQVMRLDEMIACLFTAIKLKTELDHKVEISNCVICASQCLNENQRRVISDGAYIAGLGNASMINDTNAIALAFMLKNQLFKGSVMVANTLEGFIDAACFNFDEGMLYCPGVSGNFFIKLGHNNWYHGFLEVLFGVSRSEKDEAKKNILQIFKRCLWMESGTTKLKNYPSLDNVILAGDKPIVNEIREVLNSDNQLNHNVVNHSHVEATYALFGAAYLIALNEDNPEGTIYKRWAALSKEPKSDHLDILRRNLLAQQFKDELLKLTNTNPLGHLSAPSMTYRQQQFILNEKIRVHHARILMLKKVQYLETRLKINHKDQG